MEMKNTDTEFKTWLKGVLRSQSSTIVTFTKKDGTKRHMNCTLSEDFIPGDKQPKGTEKELSVDTCRVFDLEKNEWRSFRWSSITDVEYLAKLYWSTDVTIEDLITI